MHGDCGSLLCPEGCADTETVPSRSTVRVMLLIMLGVGCAAPVPST